MDEFRRTRIVATLGPATSEALKLRALIEAGVDVVRLNFSHGTLAEKERLIGLVRRTETELGRPVAVLQDLQGPKIRVGPVPDGPVRLLRGQVIDVYEDGRDGGPAAISVTWRGLASQVKPGDSIYVDDGAVELRVISAAAGAVRCEVLVGGDISTGKGVNFAGADLGEEPLTPKDRRDLRFGLDHGVDYVAMSFVRSPKDAAAARAIMRGAGVRVPLLAKIERREAVEELSAVLRAFDGAMVARGDLGVELRPEKVPGVQKEIIARCLALGRPVITATQMLESMTVNRQPTRAEASDVANAVLDGSSAVMLSGETAVGAHPVEVVRAMHRIVVEAERLVEPAQPAIEGGSQARAVCAAAVHLAQQTGAQALVPITRSGRTAQTLSSLQPETPIIALCQEQSMARRLCLWRGILPVVVDPRLPWQDPVEGALQELRQRSLVPRGANVVTLGAAPGSRPGQTNFVRILRV